jgi:hypothetical protein
LTVSVLVCDSISCGQICSCSSSAPQLVLVLVREFFVLVAVVFERRGLDHPPNSQLGRGVVVVGRSHSDIVSTATGQEESPNFDMYVARSQGSDSERRRRAGRRQEVVG